jgi:hypothetical protein
MKTPVIRPFRPPSGSRGKTTTVDPATKCRPWRTSRPPAWTVRLPAHNVRHFAAVRTGATAGVASRVSAVVVAVPEVGVVVFDCVGLGVVVACVGVGPVAFAGDVVVVVVLVAVGEVVVAAVVDFEVGVVAPATTGDTAAPGAAAPPVVAWAMGAASITNAHTASTRTRVGFAGFCIGLLG